MNALVVADDLTGAMDTGHGFAARGRSVRVRLDRDSPSDATDVLAVDTDSRAVDAETARQRVATAFERYPATLAYKKVDSTLRGNVVAEVDAAVAATETDVAVVAPAFPAAGRTTVDGHHYVEDAPLADAGYGVDESDLRTVFEDSRYPVEHVDQETVEAGAAVVRDALAAAVDGREEPALAVCDASDASHLHAVAAGARALADGGGPGAGGAGADPLSVGSGGLAKHVAVPGDPSEAEPAPSSDPERDGVLGVVGSVNERTLAQLAAVPDELVVELDATAAVRDPERTGREAAAALEQRLDERGRAVVTAASDPEAVERAERAVEETDGEADTGALAARRVATALGAAAGATVETAVPAGLFLTGGDVARTTLDRLGAAELALTGEAVADGIPEGVVTAGPAAGTRVVTKAGGFGTEGTILNCLDALDPTWTDRQSP